MIKFLRIHNSSCNRYLYNIVLLYFVLYGYSVLHPYRKNGGEVMIMPPTPEVARTNTRKGHLCLQNEAPLFIDQTTRQTAPEIVEMLYTR